MYSMFVKSICVTALVPTAAVILHGVPQILLQLIVCGGALFVMLEAVRGHKYSWAAAFALVCLYFNPVVPFELSRMSSLAIQLTAASAFLASTRYVKPTPKMSLATITDLSARGESL